MHNANEDYKWSIQDWRQCIEKNAVLIDPIQHKRYMTTT